MISVCIATYNGARFIEAQILSILSQLSEYDEIIISDDGSTDFTIAAINQLNDSRIKVVSIDGGLGIVKNFERALYAAKGEIIFLSDQDDVWLPGKVEASLRELKHSKLVVTDCKVVDINLNEIFPSFFKLRHSKPGVLNNVFRNSYLGCCMAFRREVLNLALPIPRNVPMHDMWIGLISNCFGQVTFLATPYLLYRRHNDNASATSTKSQFGLIQQLNQRATLVYLLVCRSFSIYLRN